jgi:bifunctional DNA-binding transcriptional regulator/antitoxin component of YhaV-PrlF toxin-antitoxin module
MSEITVTALDDGSFDVEIRQGDVTSNHRVTVPEDMVDDLGLGDVDPEVLVRQSVDFLLEREPPTSILQEFALSDIQKYFDEYYDELRRRVGAS